MISHNRIDTHLAILTAEAAYLGCDTFSVSIDNTGHTSVFDFSNMNLVEHYTDTSGSKVLSHLDYGSDWSISDISPDNNINVSGWGVGPTSLYGRVSTTSVPSCAPPRSGYGSWYSPR